MLIMAFIFPDARAGADAGIASFHTSAPET
jgi:hypothetical protein